MSTRPYLGVNVNAASVEEMRYRGLLEEGETLLALFDGVLLDENRRRVGGLALADFVALTDRRVITWARGFFSDTVDGFEWKDVDVVQSETWDPWHGRVSLAFRLPPVAPRTRRVAINGSVEEPGSGERIVINTLDFMPAEDVNTLAQMVRWVGDQVVAGITGEELVKQFAERFPVVEREPLPPFFGVSEPAPPVPSTPVEETSGKRRRRWWKFGARDDEESSAPTPPVTPTNLIASYESQRNAMAAGSGVSAMPLATTGGAAPVLADQPTMYQFSRSLRLMLEAPRRVVQGLRRASEVVSGATELVSGMQDPRVRRNAMRGLYYAAARQEAEGGPLAPVGPVVRAAVRFVESPENPQNEHAQARRIQVRASVRRATPGVAPEMSGTARLAPEPPPSTETVRRSISVRRAGPSPQPVSETEGSSAPLPQAPSEAGRSAASLSQMEEEKPVAPPPAAPRTAPVRRITVSRVDRPAGSESEAEHPVSGNGKIED